MNNNNRPFPQMNLLRNITQQRPGYTDQDSGRNNVRNYPDYNPSSLNNTREFCNQNYINNNNRRRENVALHN